jgi:hypothetical protein
VITWQAEHAARIGKPESHAEISLKHLSVRSWEDDTEMDL